MKIWTTLNDTEFKDETSCTSGTQYVSNVLFNYVHWQFYIKDSGFRNNSHS